MKPTDEPPNSDREEGGRSSPPVRRATSTGPRAADARSDPILIPRIPDDDRPSEATWAGVCYVALGHILLSPVVCFGGGLDTGFWGIPDAWAGRGETAFVIAYSLPMLVLQFLYVVPLFIVMRRKGRRYEARGVVIAAALTVLVGSACSFG